MMQRRRALQILTRVGLVVSVFSPQSQAKEQERSLGAVATNREIQDDVRGGKSAFPRWASAPKPLGKLPPGADGLRVLGEPLFRGMTIGPIESDLQPGRGYGSDDFGQTLDVLAESGANWVSLTVFGRAWDLRSPGISSRFERAPALVRQSVARSVEMAHARGLRVMLVPHLWVESGGWRAEIDPQTDEGWRERAIAYESFVLPWAKVAEESGVDLFALGVEMRSWVTTQRAPSLYPVIQKIRRAYSGLLTYAANWDDAADTVIWGALDLIAINAFYPLHWEDDASKEELLAGGQRIAQQVTELAELWERPVIFSEFGYTARTITAIRPWLWPEQLGTVQVDPEAQAQAYQSFLAAMPEAKGFGGFFVWRMYADLDDLSQEAAWGFSPWQRPAYGVLEEAWKERYWGDPLLIQSAIQ
ncbi:MAG: hypothetical protein MK135_06945 [Polyangiaceae bacterium]|nr:hypothetical protein [Polyangiaceae bacterium]